MNINAYLAHQNTLGRPWTKEETEIYAKENKKMLEEINKTLRPSRGKKTGKVAIFCPGQIGDTAQVMGILKYWDVMFLNKECIWFINAPNSDLLRYSNVSEVRPWPWAGNGLNAGEPDHWPYLCLPNNKLNLELAKTRKDTADLEDGYFPATHQVPSEKREGLEYSLVSKKIFGVPDRWEWHPRLYWHDDEKKMIKEFAGTFHKNRRTVILENFAGSGQSPFFTVDTTKRIMELCRKKLGACNFVFCSHKHLGGKDNCGLDNKELFGNEDGFFSAAHFTPRQVALINDYADLFIGISSGISVVTSAWELRGTPKIQWCGSRICSTNAIANGEFILAESEFKTREVAEKDFFNKLNEILNQL